MMMGAVVRTKHLYPSLHRQQGVALITVLLVMVIAVAAVTHAVTRNRLAISRTSAILANTQLAEFVHGAEAWAIIALEKDYMEDREASSSSDNRAEAWAQRLAEFNPSNGKIRIQIKDLHSCFNVNNLTSGRAAGGSGGGTAGGASSGTGNAAVLARLVRNAGGQQEAALAIQDWVDAGDTPLASGTEDTGYLGLEESYRTPDTMITDVSELRAVQGMEPDVWSRLEPQLCALPAEGTSINVNTASQELLEAMFPSANVAGLVNQRDSGTPFTQAADLSGFGINSAGTEVDFNSEFFVAHIAVQLGLEHRQYWESVMHLDTGTGKVKVIQRQRREFSGQFLQELLGD